MLYPSMFSHRKQCQTFFHVHILKSHAAINFTRATAGPAERAVLRLSPCMCLAPAVGLATSLGCQAAYAARLKRHCAANQHYRLNHRRHSIANARAAAAISWPPRYLTQSSAMPTPASKPTPSTALSTLAPVRRGTVRGPSSCQEEAGR